MNTTSITADAANGATANRYELEGRVVIVTGAGSGIGRGIARAFLANGARVVVTGRREDVLHETVSTAPKTRSLVVTADVADRGQVDALVAQTMEHFGHLDVVVPNAAQYVNGQLADVSESTWNAMFATNVGGVRNVVLAALPHLTSSGGNIVVTSSVSGIRGDWAQSAYNATKGAVNVLVQSLALDLGAQGVRINAVAPSFTQTAMTSGMSAKQLAPFNNRIALGRPAKPEDIAPVVLFLASPDARYVTGAIVPVDGGTSASTGQPHIG